MKGSLFAAMLAALVLAGAATASPSTDMAAAIRALHYPKAGALKVGCRAAGTSFRCKATYRHRRHRIFYAGWAMTGGYICAGPRSTGCKILSHGFIPNDQIETTVSYAAEQAALGYMHLKYGEVNPQIAPDCPATTRSSTWVDCYYGPSTRIAVTVHLAKARGGYLTTVAAASY